MSWLTFRQYRVHIIVMLVVAVLLALGLAFAADYAARIRAELGVDTCVPLPNTNVNCTDLTAELQKRVGALNNLFYALYVIPALVASYLGGPLFAAEFERGTHRFAWTQSITRVRWAAVKLGVLLIVAFAGAVVVAPFGGGQHALFLDTTAAKRPFETFDIEGPALVSYFVFGLTAGALVGAWSRRVITGMFFGLLLFAVLRVGVHGLRPSYQEPVTVPFVSSGPFDRSAGLQSGAAIPPDAWVIGLVGTDLDGRPVPLERVNELQREYFAQPQPVVRPQDESAFFLEHGVIRKWAFQPADRFWTFQWIEAGIFTGLAAICALLTFLRVRGRDA